MKHLNVFLLAIFLLNGGFSKANEYANSKQQSIFEALATPDSATHATVRIYQDKRIEQLLIARKTSNSSQEQTLSGYRVQVFSSNTQRTAKTEAFKIEKEILEDFPEQGVYVNYTSPFWKVRVGDFKTQAEAQAFRRQLIEAFPNLRSGIYVVREQILSNGSK